MERSGTKRAEYECLRRVLAWCAKEVATRIGKTVRFAPRLFFARMESNEIAGIGTVEILDDSADTVRHLAKMSQVVDLPDVDVVVLVRQVLEIAARPATNLESSPVFMFHLIGKRYEATVVHRPQGQGSAGNCGADLRLDQLHQRQRAMIHH